MRILLTPEERAARTKSRRDRYREANRERLRQETRVWAAANPELVAEMGRRYAKNHPEERRATKLRWRRNNPEKARQSVMKYRENNVEKYREIRRRYLFGMAPGQYAKLEQEQGGRCAVCGKPPPEGKILVVDHCHDTGKVRGLLCHKCNSGIGLLGDTLDRARAAARYLERNSLTTQPTSTRLPP